MNTAQHVVEATVRAEECLEKNERTWAQLVHEWRGARWLPLVWLAMFACFAVVGGFVFARQAGFNGLIYLAPTAFLAITSPLVILGPRRRERFCSQPSPGKRRSLRGSSSARGFAEGG